MAWPYLPILFLSHPHQSIIASINFILIPRNGLALSPQLKTRVGAHPLGHLPLLLLLEIGIIIIIIFIFMIMMIFILVIILILIKIIIWSNIFTTLATINTPRKNVLYWF